MSGGLASLLLFAWESVLILQSGAVGLKMDTDGPFAALMAAIRPLLPGLLLKVLGAYVAAGALLGLFAHALACAVAPARRWRWLVWSGELLALALLLTWLKAQIRPALIDDLAWARPALTWMVDHGTPSQPRLALSLFVAAHLLVAALRRAWAPVVAVASAFGLTILGALASSWEPATERHPLVVLIGIDAFRPDRLSPLGGSGKVAPHLEAFLREATLFTRAYTPIAQTEPAWRALLTASWPFRTGVRYPLTAEERWVHLPTFPAALNAAGFQTRFATDCSRFNFQPALSGFAIREQPPRGAVNFLLEKLRYRALGVFWDNAVGSALLPEFIDNRALAGTFDPLAYARRLSARWVDAASAQPALLAFHSTAAHFPGDPVYPYYRKFVPPSEPLERRLRMYFTPIGAGTAGSWSREGAEALYDELLAQGDAQVGTLLDSLKAAGLYDEALVIVFSDHGESFHADHPELAGATPVHGARLSDEENQILLAMKLPKSMRTASTPSKVDALVRLIDIGPTILDVAGVPPLPGVDGKSVVPLLRGESVAPRRLYAETGFTHASPEAFDLDHWKGTPRTFDAYQILPDGRVQMTQAAHDGCLREKDVAAFDGKTWVIRSPRSDGTIQLQCRGQCEQAGTLTAWLDGVAGPVPTGGGAVAGTH